MTARQSTTLKYAIALIPLLGGAWAAFENRYVTRSEYERRALIDSTNMAYLKSGITEINIRLQQIQCGPLIEKGCR